MLHVSGAPINWDRTIIAEVLSWGCEEKIRTKRIKNIKENTHEHDALSSRSSSNLCVAFKRINTHALDFGPAKQQGIKLMTYNH